MQSMARRTSLGALAAILLTACLVLSLSVALGADDVYRPKKAAQEACKKLGADCCCQPSGVRAPIPQPDVVFAAQPPRAALPTPDPARVRPRPSCLPRQR
jgi:hypothetical protein